MVRVLVCGGRDYQNRQLVYGVLDQIHAESRIDCVIQGGAQGADYIAKLWARDRKIPGVQIDAQWSKHGRAAGPIRNQQMIDEQQPDLVVAFPGGSGTADMVRKARAAGIPVRIIDERYAPVA